jgi:hypothetical protein
MKLPENKSERAKVIVLIVAGSAGVLYGAVFGVAKPILGQIGKTRGKMDTLAQDLQQAKTLAARIPKTREENARILREVRQNTDRHMLRDTHGNYLIGAKRIIEQGAAQAGVDLKAVEEIGVSVMDRGVGGGPESAGAFKAYTARAAVRAGFYELVCLVETLEKANPFLCISQLDVVADEKDPLRHQIALHVQWPIWSSPAREEDLRKQIAGETAGGKGVARP